VTQSPDALGMGKAVPERLIHAPIIMTEILAAMPDALGLQSVLEHPSHVKTNILATRPDAIGILIHAMDSLLNGNAYIRKTRCNAKQAHVYGTKAT